MAESQQLRIVSTMGMVLVSILVLSGVDTFLARTERSENHAEAERLDASGRTLMQQGRPLDAVAQLKSALAIERENASYWLALGQAQLAAGQLGDAEATLTELLRRDSTSGAANLALARVLVKEGRIPEAISAYHRAVYGHWDGDAQKSRVDVRFELVNLLAQQGSKEELLAELLPLLDIAPDDQAMRMRLGHLFLTAGSAARAGEIFGDVLRKHPQDAAAYAGLGESEFTRGNYLSAHSDFQIASDLRPMDQTVQKRLDLTAQILELDPMRRGLGPEERYRRSVKMLDMASAAVGRCSDPASPLAADAMAEAQKAIGNRASSARLSEAQESNLNLAEQLWKIRQQECKRAPSEDEEALRLVLTKIAQ